MTTTQEQARSQDDGARYRYERFTTGLLLADLRFSRSTIRPGRPFPSFDLVATDGTRVRSTDFKGRPYVVILGSLTCPMTASAAEGLRALHEEVGDAIEFVTVYTREAHPGEFIPQPADLAQKSTHARRLAERDGYNWRVAVDDLDGTLHRQLDGKPNAAFVVDRDGRLAFRSLWTTDFAALRAAIEAVTHDEAPRRSTSQSMMRPMMRALPWVDETVRRAGRSALRDLWRSAPPMALMARLARIASRRPKVPRPGQ